MDINRVYYFSQNDMSIGYNLQTLEERLKDFDINVFVNDINDVMELYHIKKHIDNSNHLVAWSKDDIDRYELIVKSFPGYIVEYFKKIPFDLLFTEYAKLIRGYENTFWSVVSDYNLLQLIDESFLDKVLIEPYKLRMLLSHKKLVEKYSKYFHNELLKNKNSAHILIDKYARSGIEFGNDTDYFIPKTLSLADKEAIIVDYLNCKDPNLNYVRVIRQVKDNPDQIVLSPKTRLLAEDLEKELTKIFFDKATKMHISYGVEFDSSDNIPEVKIERRDDSLLYVYSTKYIESLDNESKILVFGNLFGMLGEDCIINLVNKDYETDSLELVLMDRGKDAYFMNQACVFENNTALLKTNLYAMSILPALGFRLEELIKEFYEHHLYEDYGYTSLSLTFPSEDADWMSKCRIIVPEIDAVAKQYNLFVEEDEINPRLYSLGKPILVTDVKSLFANKYVKLNGSPLELIEPMYSLFRSSDILHVVNGFNCNNVKNFFELITSNKVPYRVYIDDYRQPRIDRLITLGYIRIDEDGFIVPDNVDAISILHALWRNHAISYWHRNKAERSIIDEWIHQGFLLIDDHLLCEPERNLFSYYLNNNKYTNGPAIRNMYAHGAIPNGDDVQVHAKNYTILLLLLILFILKIEDEFRIMLKIIFEQAAIGKEHQ